MEICCVKGVDMNKKERIKTILLFSFILLIANITATTITEFFGGVGSENITLNGTTNITKYIQIYTDSTVIGSKITIANINFSSSTYIQYVPDEVDGSSMPNIADLYDGCIGLTPGCYPNPGTGYLNYTKVDYVNMSYSMYGYSSGGSGLIPDSCYNAISDKVALKVYHDYDTDQIAKLWCWNASSAWQELLSKPDGIWLELIITWGRNNTFNLEVANTNVLSVNGSNETYSISANNEVQSALNDGCVCSDCVINGSYCKIPYVFIPELTTQFEYYGINTTYFINNPILQDNYTTPETPLFGSNISFSLNYSYGYIANISNITIDFFLPTYTINETDLDATYDCGNNSKYGSGHNCSKAFDNDNSTYVSAGVNDEIVYFYANYTYGNMAEANVTFLFMSEDASNECGTTPLSCWNGDSWQTIISNGIYSPLTYANETIPQQCIRNDKVELRMSVYNYNTVLTSTACFIYEMYFDAYAKTKTINQTGMTNTSNIWSSPYYQINESGYCFYRYNATLTNGTKTSGTYNFTIVDTKAVTPNNYIQSEKPNTNFTVPITIQTNNDNLTWEIFYNNAFGENFTLLSGTGNYSFIGNTTINVTFNISPGTPDGTYNAILTTKRLIDNYEENIIMNITSTTEAGNIYLENDEDYGVSIYSDEDDSKEFTINNTGDYNLSDIQCTLNNTYTGFSFWSFTNISILEPNQTSNITLTFSTPPSGSYTSSLQCYGKSNYLETLDYLDETNRPVITLQSSTRPPAGSVGGGGGGGGVTGEIKAKFDVKSRFAISLKYFQSEGTSETNTYQLNNIWTSPVTVRARCVSESDYCKYVNISNTTIELPENILIIKEIEVTNYLPKNYTNETVSFAIVFTDQTGGKRTISNEVTPTNGFFKFLDIFKKLTETYTVGEKLKIPKIIPVLFGTMIMTGTTFFASRKSEWQYAISFAGVFVWFITFLIFA